MAFLEAPQFPVKIAYTSSGGPGYKTNVTVLNSGNEQRNQDWSQSRHAYIVNNVKYADDLATLLAFFNAMKGRLHGFRFKDWLDYKSSADTLTAVSDTDQLCTPIADASPEVNFQLAKTYVTTDSPSLSYVRNITKPVVGSVVVSANGVPQPSGWTVDTATGIITFSVAPTQPVKSGFEFDVPCRFDTDDFSATFVDKDIQSVGLPIIEIRV